MGLRSGQVKTIVLREWGLGWGGVGVDDDVSVVVGSRTRLIIMMSKRILDGGGGEWRYKLGRG